MLSKSLGLPQPICNSFENACFSNPPGRYCQASLSKGLKPATRFTRSTRRPGARSKSYGRRLRPASSRPSKPFSMAPGKCQKTVGQEAALGFDARLRSTAGNYILRASLDVLARKHRFSPAKLAASAKLLSQVLAFDVANAMSLHREAAEQAADAVSYTH